MPSLTPRLAFAITLAVAILAVILVPTLPNFFTVSSERSRHLAGVTTDTVLFQKRGDETSPASTTEDTMASIRRAAPLVFPALTRHTATVIFIHGLGDTGKGWEDAVQLWQRQKKLEEIKFILPNAPVIPITINHGLPVPGWFDIVSLGNSGPGSTELFDRQEDETGILQSRDYFHSLIKDEISNGIPADRIVIGGFSQGGAMSILSGLTAPFKIAGIVGLSSWLLLATKFKDLLKGNTFNQETPVFMGHGDADPLVLYKWAQSTEQYLKSLSYDVTLKTYGGMAHSACLPELEEVASFIASRLPAKGNAS